MQLPSKAKVTGMRLTLSQTSVKIPISRTIQWADLQKVLDIPDDLLDYEPSRTRSRATDIWRTQVLQTMSELIRTRTSRCMNKNIKLSVFRSGMERLLTRFNMYTENVKVEFREEKLHGGRYPLTAYYLDFVLLSPVPDSIRNAPGFVAEISEPVARAEFVEHANSEVVTVGEIVEETRGHQQTPSHRRSGNFSEDINSRQAITNQSDDIPVAVATYIHPLSSERSSNVPNTGIPDLDFLRREVEELRLENAFLRSQAPLSACTSEPSPAVISPEVVELRRELDEMRQMMRRMIDLSLSQQHQPSPELLPNGTTTTVSD